METLGSASETTLTIIQVIGTVAFAISGALVASRQKMDWFGAIVLGVIVAVGGGTLRDLLLGATPVFWVQSPWYIVVAAGTALAIIPLARLPGISEHYGFVLVADAAGLAVFAVLGTNTALQNIGGDDLGNAFVAVVLGVVTGVFGGILRDILANQVPAILVGDIYALAALIGASVYVVLLRTPLDPLLQLWIPILIIFGLRLLAIWRNWSLPQYKLGQPAG
jgi:uncharacterized membrane protein YeiH